MKRTVTVMVLAVVPILMGQGPLLKPAKPVEKKPPNEIEEFLNDKEPINNPFVSLLPKPEKPLPPPQPQPTPSPVAGPAQPIGPVLPQRPVTEESPRPVADFRPQLPQPPVERPQLQVMGVIWGTDQPQAIINDQILKVGDVFNDAKITKINRDGVEVQFKNKTFKYGIAP